MPCSTASGHLVDVPPPRAWFLRLERATHHSEGTNHSMRIAQVAPLTESVPPRLYGGTERVVSFLTDELVRIGHDVTLFASADSVTAARLVPMAPRALRLGGTRDALAHHVAMVHDVVESADAFDIVHFNIDYIHFAAVRAAGIAAVTTLHGR